MSIRKKIFSTKINTIQLDPFGFCNAKCWFCPVKYKPQPDVGLNVMSVSLLEKIFADVNEEKKKHDGLINPTIDLVTTAHYNEVLLYKHVEDLFKILRKYNLKTFVLSNGISLNKEKVDLIKRYTDVITQVGLNVPAFEKELWASRSGFSIDQFERLMSNLHYADQHLAAMNYNIQIHVNGIDDSSFHNMKRGDGFDELNINLDIVTGEHEKQFQLAKKMFPRMRPSKSTLFDRAGSLDILSNQDYLKTNFQSKKVVGCNSWRGDRVTQWLHINSAGQPFLCCNDYNFDYVFGDLSKQSLSEIWGSDKHINTLEKAFGEICTKCTYAVFN